MDADPPAARLAVAADIGGTFTDVVLTDERGALWSTKVPTTHDDPTAAVADGIADVLARSGHRAEDVGRVVHGTTLATNVVLERRGAPVAFLTTRGFGSMLQLGRQARAQDERHDLFWRPMPSPVPPEMTFELSERLDATGDVVRPLVAEEVEAAISSIAASDAAAVAICLLHSYVNPVHEEVVARCCRERLPDRVVVPSCEVLPQVREYDRAITTVLSATVSPVMSDYLGRLSERLRALGIAAPLHVMSSSGDLLSAGLAARRAIATIESGPAAGVIAAREIGRRVARPDLLSLDMGGTTAKAAVVRGGEVTVSSTFSVGGHTSASGQRGGGVTLAVPAIDLAEVGAGGGSIAWLDSGALRVGPRSAGSEPGPVCYGRGGSEPTVTDANVVLGYLDASSLAASDMPIDVEGARAAIARQLADPLGAGVEDAALAVHRLANAAMAGALRVVTVQRGIDPRPFALVVSGGAGPLHAAHIAELLEIETVIVPAGAGVGSAIGLLDSELGFEKAMTMLITTAGADPAEMAATFERLAAEAASELGVALGAAGVRVVRSADVRARGQIHEVTVPVPDGPLTAESVRALDERFADHQRQTFGIASTAPTELVDLRSRVIVPAARTAPSAGADPITPRPESHPQPSGAGGVRRILTGEGAVDAAVHDWTGMAAGEVVAGPALVTASDTTALVPPGWQATRDALGHLTLTRRAL